LPVVEKLSAIYCGSAEKQIEQQVFVMSATVLNTEKNYYIFLKNAGLHKERCRQSHAITPGTAKPYPDLPKHKL